MTQPSDLAYDISVCVHSDEIARESVVIWGSRPIALRPLRRLADGTLRSGIITLPKGWSSELAVTPSATQQLAVLSGRVRFGSTELGSGAFAVVTAAGVMPVMIAQEETSMILIQDAGQSYAPATSDGREPIVLPDMFKIDPFTPIIDGVPLHGFERRVLWLDPETQADTRLLRVPAGFRGVGGANWHPVEEEIFCLEGDIQPDDTRAMRAGSFLWNPARSIHGFNERTEGGCVLLEWHDGPWNLTRV